MLSRMYWSSVPACVQENLPLAEKITPGGLSYDVPPSKRHRNTQHSLRRMLVGRVPRLSTSGGV